MRELSRILKQLFFTHPADRADHESTALKVRIDSWISRDHWTDSRFDMKYSISQNFDNCYGVLNILGED